MLHSSQDSPQIQPLLDRVEMARYLGCSTRTLIRMEQRGLPRITMPNADVRYDAREVLAWLRAQTAVASTAPRRVGRPTALFTGTHQAA